MYCPNCGKPAQKGQNFCKQCGTDLRVISQALTGDLPAPNLAPGALRARAELARGIRKVCWGLGLMVFLGLITESLFLIAIGFLVLLDGVGRVTAALLHPANQGAAGSLCRSLRKLYRFDTSRIPPADAPSLLRDRPPSVTEHTTIRLEPPEYAPPKPQRERISH